jgi:hypothetical protein
MASGAELRAKLGGLHDIMSAMAGDAGLRVVRLAQHGVCAAGKILGDIAVAGCARSRRRLCRMTGLRRSGVAVYARKISVNAFLQDVHMNGDVFSLGVGQAAAGYVAS